MRISGFKKFSESLLFGVMILCFAPAIFAQSKCLSGDDVKEIYARLESEKDVALNAELRDELVQTATAASAQTAQFETKKSSKEKDDDKKVQPTDEQITARWCEILKKNGWPTENLVGKEGVAATYFLMRKYISLDVQASLVQVVALAVKKNQNERNEYFAAYIDRLRLRAGLRQIFGTQAQAANGFLVLYPLQSEKMVDEWRAQYKMTPLAEYLRKLEILNQMPLIKSLNAPHDAGEIRADNSKTTENNDAPAEAEQGLSTQTLIEKTIEGSEEVERVDTNEVNLNVVVYGADRQTLQGNLSEKDFRVFEDGREQKISFFAKSEQPFDLVLLIDISGSTSDKINLIRKSTQSFIESKRPSDRLAIVTFSTGQQIVESLTDNKEKLLKSAKEIKGSGSSRVWDALQFTLSKVFDQKTPQRRRAVVFMTDGADNALMYYRGSGSLTLYADLLETVRRGDTTVIPIYLDTEGSDAESKRVYADARRTLSLLAESSGGIFYKARRIEDLNGVYQQVLNDMSRIYSLGYEPLNDKRDGSWRSLKVEIADRPDLKAQTKIGYYAK